MAWSAPMTAVAGTAFTAAQFNQYVRDNLNETAPAKASAAGQIFVSTAANAIAARTPSRTTIATSETTASTAYVDLATPGPAVTVTCGVSAWVFVYAYESNSSASASNLMSFAISGATTLAAADTYCLLSTGTNAQRSSAGVLVQGVTPGSNTFTAKYRVAGSGTGTWADRWLTVIPL